MMAYVSLATLVVFIIVCTLSVYDVINDILYYKSMTGEWNIISILLCTYFLAVLGVLIKSLFVVYGNLFA